MQSILRVRTSRGRVRRARNRDRYVPLYPGDELVVGCGSRLPNKEDTEQLGLVFAAEYVDAGPRRRPEVWSIADGGPAPHRYEPKIPPLDIDKLPREFQGNHLEPMDNGDWLMWQLGAERPHVEGTGDKAKWKYPNPDPKARIKMKTATGGARVGRKGAKGWLRGGLTDDQLQAIQFAAALKGAPNERAKSLVKQNALYVINHSAGKDSQAMFLYVMRDLRLPEDQVTIIHADLPGADWPSLTLPSGRLTPTLLEHIDETVDGLPVRVVVARWGTTSKTPEHLRGKVKTFEGYVRYQHERHVAAGKDVPAFPSKGQRWCTSDLKTGPLNKAIFEELCVRDDLREPFKPDSSKCKVIGQPWRVVVSAEGIRAGESQDRAGYEPWELDVNLSKQGRIWFHWLPIFEWKSKSDRKVLFEGQPDVVEYILSQDQAPFWTYGATPESMATIREIVPRAEHGITRLSCQFCIFGSKKDHWLTAQLDPQGYARMCGLEKDVGSSVSMGGIPLGERTGIRPESLRVVNPWRALPIRHPTGLVPNEEYSVHDLQLAELLAEGVPSPADLRARVMPPGSYADPIATPYSGVVMIPRATGDPSLIASYDVLEQGRRVGALDHVRVGSGTKWVARVTRPEGDRDRVGLRFEDHPDEALRRVLSGRLQNTAATRVGDRVELVHTSDRHTDLRPGDLGTVDFIDDTSTVFVAWDQGSRLGLIPDVDRWTVVPRA